MTNVVIAPTAQVSRTLGDLAGTTPASGTARYYATDHLGSTRSAWNASKVAVGAYEFAPYGGEYNHTGAALDTLAGAYTGKPWDGAAQLFHFPYRQYSPNMARWTSRDPLGMVDGPNVYAYVRGNSTTYFDPDGRRYRDSPARDIPGGGGGGPIPPPPLPPSPIPPPPLPPSPTPPPSPLGDRHWQVVLILIGVTLKDIYEWIKGCLTPGPPDRQGPIVPGRDDVESPHGGESGEAGGSGCNCDDRVRGFTPYGFH